MSRGIGFIALAGLLLVSACSSSRAHEATDSAADPVTRATSPSGVATPGPATAGDRTLVLATGLLTLPAANSFGDRGFHEVLTATHQLPADIALPEEARLVVTLRDATRPDQRCTRQHPLSGCATVDWSDADGRPGVPTGGVFNNHVTVRLTQGSRTLFLSESNSLSDAPDPFRPG